MSRRRFFDRHAPTWDSEETARREADLHRVVDEADLRQGDFVLDVGTGTGVLVSHILRRIGPEGRLLALDISRAMLSQARRKAGRRNVVFVEADVHHLCTRKERFDRVICNAAFPHFEDRELGLREMVRALRPAGILVISHPIGREAVNARHRAAGGPVGEDRVPPPRAMSQLLSQAGLQDIAVIDQPEFYLARAGRPA